VRHTRYTVPCCSAPFFGTAAILSRRALQHPHIFTSALCSAESVLRSTASRHRWFRPELIRSPAPRFRSRRCAHPIPRGQTAYFYDAFNHGWKWDLPSREWSLQWESNANSVRGRRSGAGFVCGQAPLYPSIAQVNLTIPQSASNRQQRLVDRQVG